MVSALNNYNKMPADDATTTVLRNSRKPDENAAPGPVSAQNNTGETGGSRGPAVLKTLSSQTLGDLATRQRALDALSAKPDDLNNALSGQIQKGTDAINTLDQARKSTAADRKKEAEQKLEQANKKLQLLQMLGGDPTSMAKQAKDISKELKNAATEYMTALKDEAGGSAEATAGSLAGPAAVATTATSAASELAASPGAAVAAAQPAAVTASATGSAQAMVKTVDIATPPRAVVQPPLSAAEKAAADAATYRKGQHERDVVATFKAAAKTVKEIMDNAAQQVKAKNPLNSAASGTTQVRAEMDKAVGDLSDTVRIKQSGSDVSGSSSGLTAAPSLAVDISA